MQSYYSEQFERDMACTEGQWLGWLPAAIGDHAYDLAPGRALVTLRSGGELELRWQALPPRIIALAQLPRLQVWFTFSDVAEAPRQAFMRRFDLYMQRGGG